MGILRGGRIIPRVMRDSGIKSLEEEGYNYIGSRAYCSRGLLLESALKAKLIGGYWVRHVAGLFYVPFSGKDEVHTNCDIFEYVEEKEGE